MLPYYHTGHAAEANARLRAREQRDVDIKRLWKRLIQTPQDFAGYPGPQYVPNCGCGAWFLAGTGADVANGSPNCVWTSPGNITASDGLYASNPVNATYCDFLTSGTHGFSVPADLVVVEVWATVIGYTNGAINTMKILYPTLTLDGATPANGGTLGTAGGSAVGMGTITLPTANGPVVFGGVVPNTPPNPNWNFPAGTYLTGAQVNTAGFGLMFSCANIGLGGASAYIDSVSLMICGYLPPFPYVGPNN